MSLAWHISSSTLLLFERQYHDPFSRPQRRLGPEGPQDLDCREALGSIEGPLGFEAQESSYLHAKEVKPVSDTLDLAI